MGSAIDQCVGSKKSPYITHPVKPYLQLVSHTNQLKIKTILSQGNRFAVQWFLDEGKKVPFELTTKQQSNAEYLAKLDESIAQAERGEVVKYTMDELKAFHRLCHHFRV